MPSITEFAIVLICMAKASLLVAGSASGLYLTGRAASAVFGRTQSGDPRWTQSRRGRKHRAGRR